MLNTIIWMRQCEAGWSGHQMNSTECSAAVCQETQGNTSKYEEENEEAIPRN